MSESEHNAVFLSYASQDVEAAKRIGEALRAAGVEVWFDQNELVGGDAWDQKIRGQIGSCALFVPLISANTQARREGYFRIEWRLAAQRTHAMADGTAFLLPVVVDATRDTEALVPAEFKSVQWTKLPGGETPPAFVARLQRLLEGETEVARASRPVDVENMGQETRATQKPIPRTAKPSPPKWLRPILASAVIVIAVLAFTLKSKFAQESAASAAKASPPGSVEKTASKPEVAALLARVRASLGRIDTMRAELDTMEGLLGEAAKLDRTDASVWALWALLDCRYLSEYYDQSPERRDAARQHAAQARGLDPTRPDVRLAQAFVMSRLGNDVATQAEAVKILRPLLDEIPGNGEVPIELGWLEFFSNHPEAALSWLDRAALVPGNAARAHFDKARLLVFTGRPDQAGAEFDRALDAERASKILLWKSYILMTWNGDLVAARKALDEVPPQVFVEDMPAVTRYYLELLSRNYDRALAAIRAVPHNYFQSVAYSGPAGYFNGTVLELAGKTAAAELERRSALATVERRLAAEPNDSQLMMFKALLQTALGEREAGLKTWKAMQELYPSMPVETEQMLQLQLQPEPEAFAWVEGQVAKGSPIATAAVLRLDPVYDPIRSDPRFPALLARAEADPRLSPAAKASSSAKATKDWSSTNSVPDQKSVAVLAFANLSDDKGNEYFSDGISEELLNVMAKIPGLKVTARTSSFHFKGKDTSIPDIAKQLGVAYVVEGSVRKAGDKVRITAQLIKAADDFHVWSETFTRDLKDIFAVQDEIAGLIAQNLQLKIEGAVAAAPVEPEAFRLLLAGRAKVREAGNANRAAAIADFRRAVAIAPNFAAAWAELARALIQEARSGTTGLEAAYAEARAAVQRAVAVDPDSPDVLVALGWVRRTADWDWRGAEQAFRRALAISPNSPGVVADAAVMINNLGHVDESIRLAQRAVELDPLNPEAYYNLSMFLGNADRLAESADAARRAVELAPRGDLLHRVYSNTLADLGRLEEAAREAELETDELNRTEARALILLRQGKKTEALALAHALERGSNSLQDLAELYALAGDRDLAFSALDRCYARRETGMVWLKVDNYFRNLYDDPRWLVLLRKMKLADDPSK